MDFGPDIVDAFLWSTLNGLPAVTSVVGSSIHGLTYVPQNYTYPAILYYCEFAQVDGPAGRGGNVTGYNMRYVVRVSDEGTSAKRIRPVALAFRAALEDLVANAPTGEQLTFTYSQDFVPMSSVQGSQGYRHHGCIYNVTATSGG